VRLPFPVAMLPTLRTLIITFRCAPGQKTILGNPGKILGKIQRRYFFRTPFTDFFSFLLRSNEISVAHPPVVGRQVSWCRSSSFLRILRLLCFLCSRSQKCWSSNVISIKHFAVTNALVLRGIDMVYQYHGATLIYLSALL